MSANRSIAWLVTVSAVLALIAAIGGGSWLAAYYAGLATLFAWRLALPPHA